MKSGYLTLMFLIFLRNLNAACAEGTLRCNADDKSLVCDFLNGYALNDDEDSCVQKTVEGCQVLGIPGYTSKCYMCQSNYIYDSTAENCAEVPTEKRIEGCATYSVSGENYSCTKCESGKVIDGSACIAVPEANLIEKCEAYTKSGDNYKCSSCSNGTFGNSDETTCTEFTVEANCMNHSDRKCEKCPGNYFLNRSIPVQGAVNSSLYENLVLVGNKTVMYAETNSKNVCQESTIKNCSVLKSFDTCSTCNSGYFLNSDNLCELYPEDPLANCKKYLNATSCLECDTMFWLDGSNCAANTVVPECESYNDNQDGCKVCKTGFFLTAGSPGTCNERTPIDDCLTPNPNADECSTCQPNFTKTTDNKACLANVPNCIDHKEAANKDGATNCEKCEMNDYFLENPTTCSPRTNKSEFCETYEIGSDQCSKCQLMYYSNTEKTTCTAISIDNCKSAEMEVNECIECENLYYPQGNNCSPITDLANCIQSDGKSNKCKRCKVGFFRQDPSFDCTGTRTYTTDPNCESSYETKDSGVCTYCQNNFITFEMSTLQLPSTSNCEVAKKESNGKCLRCKQDYELQSDKSCSATSVLAANKICLQKVDDNEETLDLSTKCNLCNNELDYYLNGEDCVKKTSSKMWTGCTDTSEGNGTCMMCDGENDLVPLNQFTCSLGLKDGSSTLIPNCVEYSSFGVCTKCKGVGYAPSNNGTQCTKTDANTVESFDLQFTTKIYNPPTPTVAGCETYAQKSDTSSICVKCSAATVAIIGTLTGSTFSITHETIGNGELPNHTKYNSIIECKTVTGTDWHVQNSNSGLAINSTLGNTDCAAAYQTDTATNRLCCVKCHAKKSGSFINHTNGSSDTAYQCLKSCEDIPNASEDTSVVGIGIGTDDSVISRNHILQAITCDTDGESPVVHAAPFTSQNLGLDVPAYVSDGTTALQTCEVVPTAQVVTNCYMYSYPSTPPSSADLTALRCLVCQPGYVLDPTGDTTCTLINNCASSGNTWLGGCDNPTNGFIANAAGDWDSSTLKGSSGAIANCLLHGETSGCLICKQGYQTSSDGTACEDLSTHISDCTTPGWGSSNIRTLNNTANDPNDFNAFLPNNRAILSKKFNGKESENCDACSTNRFGLVGQFLSSAGSTLVTTTKCASKNSNNMSVTGGIANCKVASFDDTGASSTLCSVCQDGFVLSVNNTCVDATNDANCKVFATTNTCSECKDGYYVSMTNTCVATNCATWSVPGPWKETNGTCLLCKNEFKLKVAGNVVNKYDCDAMTQDEKDNTTCATFSPEYESCVKCKTVNNQVVRFLNSSSNPIGWRCDTKDLSGSLYSNYPENLVFNYKLDDEGTSTVNGSTPESAQLNYDFDSTEASANISQTVCFPQLVDTNCTNLENSLYCNQCNTGYYVEQATGMCKANPENCKEANTDGSCSKCIDTHFVSGTTCEQRSESSVSVCGDATRLKSNADECSSCNNQEKYMSTDNVCVAGTASYNCKIFNTNVDSCSECKDNHYMNTDNHCKPYSNATNCSDANNSFNMTKDECLKCAAGYWLNASLPQKVCTQVTGGNCKEAESGVDSCETCNPGYLRTGGVGTYRCEAVVPVDNCKDQGDDTYVENTNNCNMCNDGYYRHMSGQECRLFPDGITNCSVYTNRTTCDQCKDEFYLDSNECKAVETTIEGCVVYSSATNCQACESTKFLKQNECVTITATGCATIIDEETCDLCLGNTVKDDNNKNCVASGIANCLVPVKGSTTNTCDLCEAGNLPSDDGASCVAVNPPIADCDHYETTTTCKTCSATHILALDKKSCVPIEVGGVNTLGPMCDSGVLVADPVCSVCYPGFKSDTDGKCVALEMAGCLVENITDGSCMICSNTHYMNKELKCVENPTDDGDDDKSVKLINTLTIFMLFAFMINKMM